MSKFSDQSDWATELEERERQAAIQRIRSMSQDPKLLPMGLCHNCGDPVGKGMVFCDKLCAEDYEEFKKAEERNGRF